jgi:hypothetical protein
VKKLIWRVTLGVAAGVAIYVGFSVWAGARSVGQALASFNWAVALLALALASLNYGVRFARWHYYLKVLGLRQVTAGHSFLIFLAGFSLTVTPGKLGEAVKALLLRESHGIPAARTAPIVIAERFTDLVGLLLLACVGVFTFHVDRRFLATGAVVIGLGLVVISVESIALFFLRLSSRLPGVHSFADKLHEAYRATATLLRPGPLGGCGAAVDAELVLRVRGFLGGGARLSRRCRRHAGRHLHLRLHDCSRRALIFARRSGRDRGRHACFAGTAGYGNWAQRGRRRHLRHTSVHAVVCGDRWGCGPVHICTSDAYPDPTA